MFGVGWWSSCVDLRPPGGVMVRSVASGSALLRVRTASAVVVMCLIAVSVSTPPAAASTARSVREMTGIAWTKFKDLAKQFQCSKVSVPFTGTARVASMQWAGIRGARTAAHRCSASRARRPRRGSGPASPFRPPGPSRMRISARTSSWRGGAGGERGAPIAHFPPPTPLATSTRCASSSGTASSPMSASGTAR